jgi:hypothetical protein
MHTLALFTLVRKRLDYQRLAQNHSSVPDLAECLPSVCDVIHREKQLVETKETPK